MVACAMLVAALAVQPAAGQGKPDGVGNGSPPQAKVPGEPGPAPAAGDHPAAPAADGPEGHGVAGPEDGDTGAAPTLPPAVSGTASPPSEDNAGVPSGGRSGTADNATATPVPSAGGTSTAGGTAAPATGTATAGSGVTVAEQIPVPDVPQATQRRPASSGPAATRAPATPLVLAQAPVAIPVSALEAPLRPPATEAITRVRPIDGVRSGGPPQSANPGVSTLREAPQQQPGDDSVAEVLVSWAKYALAGLGLLVLLLGVNAIVAATRTRRLERQRERLMEDIGLLQAALLPAVPGRLGALLTTVAYRPADGPAAGGDFYDAFALPDGRVGLLLGDVSGHGRQALAKTTLVRFSVRAHLEAGLSPREAIAIAGRSLDGRLSDDFATVVAAIHDPVKGTLTYASAGHPPPIVVGTGGHRPVTVSSAPPIGVGFPTGQRQTVLPMPEGTSVMIYSDGLLEARVDGVPLGPERLTAWLEELGPEATAKAVLERVVLHADRVPDDLAAVLLHAAPGATAPASRIEQLKLDVLDVDGPDLDGFLRACGVSDVDRLIAGRRASELLASASGVVVEVRAGEHPVVSVAPIGEESSFSARPRARAR